MGVDLEAPNHLHLETCMLKLCLCMLTMVKIFNEIMKSFYMKYSG